MLSIQHLKSKIAHDNEAFTLVELLVVMLVLIVLLGITLPVSKYVAKRTAMASAGLAREKVVNALEEYRARYGEYPIPGSLAHYPTSYIADPFGYSPLTNVDLISTQYVWQNNTNNKPVVGSSAHGLEYLPYGSGFTVDYRLTWPLMLGPIARGEPPILEFSEQTVCSLAYKVAGDDALDTVQRTVSGTKLDGSTVSKSFYYMGAKPIRRYKALSPSGNQWLYESPDGKTYTLDPNGLP